MKRFIGENVQYTSAKCFPKKKISSAKFAAYINTHSSSTKQNHQAVPDLVSLYPPGKPCSGVWDNICEPDRENKSFHASKMNPTNTITNIL